MHSSPPTATAPTSNGHAPAPDETTRHLVAAVHLKPELADRIVGTYLGARRGRGLPPAQGLDARLVLTQALLAQRRRRTRDALVLGLMLATTLLTAFYSFVFAMAWAVAWLFWSLTFGMRRAERNPPRPRRDEDEISTAGLVTTLLYFVGAFVSVTATSLVGWMIGGSDLADLYDSGGYDGSSTSSVHWLTVLWVFAILLCVAALYAVLLVDKWLIRQCLAAHDGSGRAPTAPGLVSRVLASLHAGVTRRHGQLLEDVGNRGDDDVALVHTGWHAFVGHGSRVNAWTVPLVLRPTNPDASVEPLRPRELYQAVNDELAAMRDSDLLAPSRRLRDLAIAPLVVVSEDGLRRHRHTQLGQRVEASLGAPASGLPPELLTELVDRDQEWVRHFQRSTVVSWDAQLSVATFLNIGCDERTLYLEWNAFCLYPIAPEHRRGDSTARSLQQVAGSALLEFCQLLGSIAWRSRNLTHVATAGPETSSIREIAAHDRCVNEFQDLDGQRYITLLEERTFSAVRNHLTERGYDTEGLDQSSTRIINNTSNNFANSQFLGVQQFGASSTATVRGAGSDDSGSRRAKEAR